MQGTRTTVSGDNGGYQFSGIPPGEYKVQFELSGLQTTTKRASLSLSQTARADADMKVSGVTEAITVTASAPTVLSRLQVASTFTSKQIEELPVARTLRSAALLSPGVNGNTLSAAQFSISGSPGYDNLVMVNGVVVTENVRSQYRVSSWKTPCRRRPSSAARSPPNTDGSPAAWSTQSRKVGRQ